MRPSKEKRKEEETPVDVPGTVAVALLDDTEENPSVEAGVPASSGPAEDEGLRIGAFAGGGTLSRDPLNGFRNDLFDAAWMAELEMEVAFRRTGDSLE